MSLKIAKSLSLKSADGVLVRDVVLGGASDKAGFKRGDLILKFAGKKIKDFNTMVKAAGAIKHGQTIKVAILRHGKPMTLSLTLGKWTAPRQIKIKRRRQPSRLRVDDGIADPETSQRLRPPARGPDRSG